jgi:glucose/arabinose dehydrogenase
LIETSPGVAELDQIIVDAIPGAFTGNHNGGRLKIGPDRKLWLTTGTTRCFVAQDLSTLDGKILRVNLDGTAPDDNPFPEAPLIYSYGHRNPQGLAFDSSGQVYSTEHGPTTDCGWPGSSRDEVNIIYPGGNYGWPYCAGPCDPPDDRFIDPVRAWLPASQGGEGTAAPAGATFHPNGWLYFGTLGATFTPPPVYARHIHGILFDMPGGTQIVDEATLFFREFGRIREVVMEPPPGQYLYFSTSNRDLRSDMIHPDDDRVLRVRF